MTGNSLVLLKPEAAKRSAAPRGKLLIAIRLIIIAAVAVMFPVVYTLAIIFCTGLAIWHSHQIIQVLNLDSNYSLDDSLRVLLLFVEAIATFLLVRQVLTPSEPRSAWQEIRQADQPELFEMIRLVADKVAAPTPKTIFVDCGAKLRADYTSSFGALLGHGFHLRLGMSLPVGMTGEHFIAMLAHELSFYSWGTAVMAARIIREVHHWFHMRIRHDPWLDPLQEKARHGSGRIIRTLARLAWLAVWLSLRPLRLLFSVCRFLTAGSIAGMVMRADDCAARVAGSATAAEAIHRRALTINQWTKEHNTVRNESVTDRLPDNIPLLTARAVLLNPDALGEDPKRRTHWLDLAPPDEARIKRLMKTKVESMLTCKGDGTCFFRNFHEMSRRATYFHYLNDWGLKINEHRLVAVEETVHEHRASNETINVLNRYFRGLAHPERAFCGIAEEHAANRESEVLLLELQDCRDWLGIYSERMASALEDWTRTWQLVRELEMGHLLAVAGMPNHRGQFALSEETPEAFREEINRQRGIMDNMEGMLRQYEGKLETRLASSLELLWRASPDELPPKLKEVRETLPHWVLVYEGLGLHLPVVRELMTHFHAFQALGAAVAGVIDSATYVSTVWSQLPRLARLVKDIIEPLSKWPYPFQTNFGPEPISMAAFIAPQAMEPKALDMAGDTTSLTADRRAAAQESAKRLTQIIAPMLDRYLNLYHQAFAWVTKTADMAEWHFLDPFDPEFVKDHQSIQRSQRHVEAPEESPGVCDPEVEYALHAERAARLINPSRVAAAHT